MRLANRLFILVVLSVAPLAAEERTQSFDRDPKWDGHNNRIATAPRPVRQDFGFRKGQIGGFLSSAAEPAYYAKKIAPRTLDDELSASGTLRCDGPQTHFLLGFFNAGTLNEWRTPNTIALRISPRGDVFLAWLEYCTRTWRAGGDSPRSFPMKRDPKTGRPRLVGFASKKVWKWSLRYDPRGNGGRGVITATIGDQTAVCNLADGHKADGATFNRFGLLNVMKTADGGGEVWAGDLTVNGRREELTDEKGWEGHGNRRTFTTKQVRPRFDFGFSPTSYAGGKGKGELGGLVFRGDCRYPDRMACYGDRLGDLTLARPLRASGKVCLRRGVTDSTVLLGFYHSRDSMTSSPSQKSGLPRCFLGAGVEGPSREGFFFAPLYRVNGNGQGSAHRAGAPPIYPDGKPHDWSLEYSPAGDGSITVTLDKRSVRLDLKKGDRSTGARFDRFGLITTWIDGNGQNLYFDDLTYTCKQD